MAFFTGEILTNFINTVATSLLIPVLIVLVVIVIWTLVEIGILIAEYSKRNKLSDEQLDKIVDDISNAESNSQIEAVINSSNLNKEYIEVLLKVLSGHRFSDNTMEAYSRKVIDSQEFALGRTLSRTDIISRIGSGCGLLGTLIPLGPGLASLGSGDIATLSAQLIIAFNTTTVGLAASLIAYLMGKIRRSWYEEDMATIYVIAEAIAEKKL
ncbi:MAG: MotA/TolQ/ExbB proton channel family protein [Methanosphaera sp.]|nr:MotA/TolQ/ExbB proton channel family protein [Methanosphaera sp.]